MKLNARGRIIDFHEKPGLTEDIERLKAPEEILERFLPGSETGSSSSILKTRPPKMQTTLPLSTGSSSCPRTRLSRTGR